MRRAIRDLAAGAALSLPLTVGLWMAAKDPNGLLIVALAATVGGVAGERFIETRKALDDRRSSL